MEAILARRFVFCDFSDIAGFPNPMLSRVEWEGILPTFIAEDWEVPAEHLLDFHEFVHKHQIMHKDVKIKLFRYSLKGATLDWCRSLPALSIHSLASFHYAFHSFCKDKFSAENLFEDRCDEIEGHIQQKAVSFSDCKNENHVIEEDFPDLIENSKDGCIVIDALDFVSDTPVVLDLNEKIVEEEVFPQLLQKNSYDMLLHVIKEETQEAAHQEQIYEATYDNIRFNQHIYESILPICHAQSEPVEQIYMSEREGKFEQQTEVKLFGFRAISFLYDPVAIYMESYFSEDFSFSIFEIKADDDCEYMLQIQTLLQVMNSPLILVCIERVFVISPMLSWLHWKHDVT